MADNFRGRRGEVLRLLFVTILVPVLGAGSAVGQSSTTYIESGLERDVNQYRWRFGAGSNVRVGKWRFDLRNRFDSDAFILFEDQLRFRDENQLSWQAQRPFNSVWTSVSEGRLSYFSQSRVLIQQAFSGLEYHPVESLMLRPMFGVAWDQRPGGMLEDGLAPLRSDLGPAGALSFAYRPELAGNYSLSMGGSGSYLSMRPRRGYTVSFRSSAGGSFEETSLESRLQFGSARRDVYQSASFLNRGLPTNRLSETIEATSSDTLSFGAGIQAPIGGRFHITSRLDGTLMRRFIRTHRAPGETLYFDTDLNRRSVDFETGITYSDAARSGRVVLSVSADSEARRLANRDRLPSSQASQKSLILQQADYERSVIALRSGFQTRLGSRGSVRLESLFSIVRRDTPEINLDDRDEAYHHATIAIAYRWSRYLQTELTTFGSYFHTVYLNAVRSAENNVQQSLRLRPLVRWTPGEASRIELRSEVRATYTVDDFTLPGRRPTDQSARELRYELEVERDLGAGLRFVGETGFTDLRLGRLMWDSFGEIPFDTLRTYNGWLRLQAGRQIVSEIGFRYFIRTGFNRSTSMRYPLSETEFAIISRPAREWIRQIGPTAAISARFGRGSTLQFSGWYNLQRISHRLYGSLPTDYEGVIRNVARRGRSQIIPNMTLTLRWVFD